LSWLGLLHHTASVGLLGHLHSPLAKSGPAAALSLVLLANLLSLSLLENFFSLSGFLLLGELLDLVL